MADIVKMENVLHSYTDKEILKDLNITVEEGQFVCLLGPSGCGKTTILRIAAGLEVPQKGKVSIAGVTVYENGKAIIPPEKRGLGVVFQDFALFPHLSVTENVGFGLQKDANIKEKVLQALKYVDMESFKNCYPSELSGGQQQRVSLARAIAPQPKLVLLDEPFSHLDSRLKQSTRDQTLHILKSVGAAGLMITHDPEEAMFMADKIIVMDKGQILQEGTPTEIYFNPKNPFIANFFGDVNTLFGTVKDNCIYTPAGCVQCPNLQNGTPVEVLVRPEGIEILSEKENCSGKATVEDVRMLGAVSLVHLNCFDDSGQKWHMHVRSNSSDLPKIGQDVFIRLKKDYTFAFPVVL